MPGRTLTLLPNGARVTKLYSSLVSDSEASKLTVASETAALNRGHGLVVHAGHGAPSELTLDTRSRNVFTADMAHALVNETLPIFLSCACEAGSLSSNGNGAGAKLITAPKGGAIAYLGNSAQGLGLAGGMQLIDEMLRFMQNAPNPILGDAYLTGRQKMPRSETVKVPLMGDTPLVDEASYRWTQKSVVLFGDPLIPVWTAAPKGSVTITVKRDTSCANKLAFRFGVGTEGTLRVLAGDKLYEVELSGTTAELVLPEAAGDSIVVGLSEPGHLFGYTELALSSLEGAE
jgi:hypothetical protein